MEVETFGSTDLRPLVEFSFPNLGGWRHDGSWLGIRTLGEDADRTNFFFQIKKKGGKVRKKRQYYKLTEE